MTDEEFAVWLGNQLKSPDRPRTYSPKIDDLLADYEALKALDPENEVRILQPVKNLQDQDMAIRITGIDLTTTLLEFVKSMQHADFISVHASNDGQNFVIELTYKKVSLFKSTS